jgi:hypothetical protein
MLLFQDMNLVYVLFKGKAIRAPAVRWEHLVCMVKASFAVYLVLVVLVDLYMVDVKHAGETLADLDLLE